MNTDYASAPSQWACHRKKRYDEKLATKVANRLRFEKGADVQPYACTRCGGWHIGRRPQR